MKKDVFIREFAKRANLTQKDAREVVVALFDTIFEAMKDEDGVSPVQGVKFMTTHRDARTARNPQTGEAIAVAAKDVPKVKFSPTVKEMFA